MLVGYKLIGYKSVWFSEYGPLSSNEIGQNGYFGGMLWKSVLKQIASFWIVKNDDFF